MIYVKYVSLHTGWAIRSLDHRSFATSNASRLIHEDFMMSTRHRFMMSITHPTGTCVTSLCAALVMTSIAPLNYYHICVMYQSMNDYVYICVICEYNYIEEKVERINNIYKNLFILIVLIFATLAEFWESILRSPLIG